MILVTGAKGFVGSALMRRLAADGVKVRGSVRKLAGQSLPGVQMAETGEISGATDWGPALEGVTAVIHTAARVHVMKESISDPMREFRKVNTEGTLNLAAQAANAGVKRFVFVSTIKVNGEATLPGQPFTADDAPDPQGDYAVSKCEAESGLRELAKSSGMSVTIVRPPLVYGKGAKGNFASMQRWLARGIPLPLGAVNNRRSLVALDNLADLLTVCASHPAAANETFLVSDGEDLSVTSLLRRLGLAIGAPARLVPVPTSVLSFAAGLMGKRDVAVRLFESLQVDISKTRQLLNWSPPISVDDALRLAADHAGVGKDTD